MLNLSRPIVFFDLETTGVNHTTDRIVELAAIRIEVDGTKKNVSWLVNPCMPIPQGASAIHGITDEMVKNEPTLGERSAELFTIFEGADIGGYNVKNFDLPVLRTECERIGLSINLSDAHIVDAMSIFMIKEPRTLSAAYEKYCGKKMENAHEALADIEATVEVLEGQLNMYADLPKSPKELHNFCFPLDPNAFDQQGKLTKIDGRLFINFGKNKGKAVEELAKNDPSYLQWILKGDFSAEVKNAVIEIMGK